VSGRLVSLGLVTALLVAGGGALVAACYEVPRPTCGFLCGPDNACPGGYACANDHYCHRLGTSEGFVCGADAAVDGLPDAMPDAMPDAVMMDDAPVDAGADAPDDAPM
jgi:hypothetical protein